MRTNSIPIQKKIKDPLQNRDKRTSRIKNKEQKLERVLSERRNNKD